VEGGYQVRCALASIAVIGACASDGGPRLVAAAPAAAARGQNVTLSGERLCGPRHDCAHAGGQVVIGLEPPQVAASIVSYEDATAVIGIPAIAPVGQTALLLTVDDQASNALAFEVLP